VKTLLLPGLPEKGDVSDWLDAAHTLDELQRLAREASKHQEQQPDFAPIPWVYRDPTTIPPREWLLGTTLLRSYATVLGSTGGVGKTAYAIA
jgi:hypothetical protein